MSRAIVSIRLRCVRFNAVSVDLFQYFVSGCVCKLVVSRGKGIVDSVSLRRGCEGLSCDALLLLEISQEGKHRGSFHFTNSEVPIIKYFLL